MEQKAKILIVEDEAIFMMSLKSALTKSGYHVCEPVSTGEEAVKRAKLEKPDLVLLDVSLRCKMDGFETANRIRSFYNIPIIFMSGFQAEELSDKIKSVEGSIFLVKPFTTENLILTIDQSLKEHLD